MTRQLLLLPTLFALWLRFAIGENATAPPTTVAPTAPLGWEGCHGSDPNEVVKIGQPTTICVVLANEVQWANGAKYVRLNFRPIADTYARFHVPKSYRHLVIESPTFKDTNVALSVMSQRQLSFQRLFTDAAAFKVYPFTTAIIDVDNGVVRGIVWDDSCIFCDPSTCDEITYDYNGNRGTQKTFDQPTKGCSKDQGGTAGCNVLSSQGKPDCDVLLYVVWTGTDADGIALQSSNSRFSLFEVREVQDRLQDNLPIPAVL